MQLLEDQKFIRRIDRGGMLGRAAILPDQCADGWQRGLSWAIPSRFASSRHLLVLGMGGSAIGADFVQGILADRIPRPIFVNRTYTLPAWVGRETLVLACSYSGNTEESLSAARQAKARGARMSAITSGGQLAAWAERAGFPLLQIPAGLPPRSAVGYLAFAPLGMLVRLGWVSQKSLPVEPACESVSRYIDSHLAPAVRTASNPAKRLAAALVGRLPILYGASSGWEGVTYRWRTQLEENSKTLAFHHLFPESTHNEISAWLQPKSLIKKMTAVFLSDPAIHPRILRRMEFVRRIIKAQGAGVETISVEGKTHLERLLRLVALGDFTSVYLSLLYRIDPTPVVRVEALKRYMVDR